MTLIEKQIKEINKMADLCKKYGYSLGIIENFIEIRRIPSYMFVDKFDKSFKLPLCSENLEDFFKHEMSLNKGKA